MARPEAPDPTRVFLVCSGLGRVRRGYETFMQECFDALARFPALDVRLFKGGGPDGWRSVTLPNLHRSGYGARIVGELTRRGPYVVEQVTFTAGLLPRVARERPDVVYYCDPTIGKLLWHWRRLSGAPFRLLLHNGGPHPPPYRWCDHVHQLTPVTAADATAHGVDPSRQTVLPAGTRIGPVPRAPDPAERARRRAALGLPADRPLVLSVGALNRAHKRMDYLVREIASLPEPRPFLVMLGEVERETPSVRAIGDLRLGPDGYRMGTLPRDAVDAYYRAADAFVLASLVEAFGLVLAEALAHGLPCIAHDHPVARLVLDGEGYFADLREPGALAHALIVALATPDSDGVRARRHQSARDRFGWSALGPRYAAMLAGCAGTAPVTSTAPIDDLGYEAGVAAS